MSFHDQLAENALRAGNSPEQFRAAAQRHANSFWFFMVGGAAVWFFASGAWALVPFAIAAYRALQSVSATLTARRLEDLQRTRPQAPTATLPSPIDLDDVLHVTIIDDIRAKYSALIADESHAFSACMYRPASLLPYPKPDIRRALEALLDFVEGRRSSRFLDSSIRSPQVAETIRSSLVLLDDFLDIPAEQLPTDPRENARVGLAHLERP